MSICLQTLHLIKKQEMRILQFQPVDILYFSLYNADNQLDSGCPEKLKMERQLFCRLLSISCISMEQEESA